MRKNVVEANIDSKCGLCRKPILIDKNGAGGCEHCGWIQVDVLDPDKIDYPNTVSFNKAKELLKEGKKIEPDFEEFVECLRNYRHMEFVYNNKKFGVTWGREVAFYEWNIVESTQKYSTLEEFYANASHNGALLKDIWPYVENAGYMVG